jgi:UrcA family protein
LIEEKVMKTIAQNHRNFTLAAVAAVCLAAVTVGARANEAVDTAPALTVHYADLNLNTRAGAAVLYKRIRLAAKQVCGDVGVQPLVQAAPAKACVKRAVFESVHAVNKPLLTSEFNIRTGGAQPVNFATVR